MVLMFLAATAQAEPDELRLTAMNDWQGIPYTSTSSISKAYVQVVKQLSASIANNSGMPAKTLGIYGVELTLRNSFSFIDSKRSLDNSPSPWALVTPDEDPNSVLWLPEIYIRKGLPLSAEIGAKIGQVGFSQQGGFGGWLRVSPIEGYNRSPELTFQLGYAGFVGSSELGAGAMDISTTIGKEFAFGYLKGVNSSVVSPFLSMGFLFIRANPRISKIEQENMGISTLSGFSSSQFYTEGYRPFFISCGTQIRSQDVHFQIDYRYTTEVLSSVSLGIGLNY